MKKEMRYVVVAIPKDLAIEFTRQTDSEAPATAVRRLVERRLRRVGAEPAPAFERPEPRVKLRANVDDAQDRLSRIKDRAQRLAQESNLEPEV